MTDTHQARIRIRITQAEFAESPREASNLGCMVCWHPRYTLGDVRPKRDPREFLYDLGCEAGGSRAELPGYDEANEADEAKAAAAFDAHYVKLPLYLYDHSGITMATSPFSCPWDSGQVGFIFAPRNAEGLTDDSIRKVMQSEVEIYDQYLRGDVYQYEVEERHDGEWLPMDSCSGFYGADISNSMDRHIDATHHALLEQALARIGRWIEEPVADEGVAA